MEHAQLVLAIVLPISGTLACAATAQTYENEFTLDDFQQDTDYSPYAGQDYPDELQFGDTHFHTELSFDADLVGTTLDVDDGY